MGSLKSFVLAGAAAFTMIQAAFAADLPPLPPPMLPPVQAPVEEFSGWYLRGDVGVGRQTFSDFAHTQTNANFVWPASWRIDQKDIKDTAFVGFGVGYQWNPWFRTDATAEYRASTKGKAIGSYTEFCPGGRCFDVYDFDHQASVFLFNAYVDLGTWWCVTPFVGAGVGAARHDISSIHDVGFIADGSTGFGLPDFGKDRRVSWDFAWAVHAGLGYNVSNNLRLEFAYRYLNMGSPDTAIVNCNSFGCAGTGPRAFYTLTDLTSHDFKIGMRWLLNEPVPPPPPVYAPPLIRKG
jgi:opacity protein-like surface antigen